MIFSLVCILSLSVVSAADYGDIRDRVNNANSGATINIGSDTYTTDGNHIRITGKTLTIQGSSNANRATLNGNNNNRAFFVDDGATLTLRYINFVNAADPNYNAISSSGTLIVENCTFTGSKGDSGASIYLHDSASGSRIINTRFIDNKADNTGLNAYAAGGAICVNGANNVEIRNCYFSGNTALNSGGAIVIRNDAVNARIINCEFVNNRAPNSGAIYVQNAAGTIISGCTFTSNVATTGPGGAIYSISPVSIVSCTFNRNSAKNNGGAIYTSGSGISTITSSRFTNNTANFGGGLYNNAPLSISSSTFTNNKATNHGGAIYANSALNIAGGSIRSNIANNGSGIYNLATLRISKVSFSSNVAKIYGIGLSAPKQVLQGKTLTVKAFVTKGDNMVNSIFTKTSDVRIDGKIGTISNRMPNKVITIVNANKKVNKRTASNGMATHKIATTKHKAKKNYNIRISSSVSHNNKKFTKSVTVKAVTKLTKPTTKAPTVKPNTQKYKDDMDRVTQNTKGNVTSINSKHVSYWNKKINKDTKLYPYIRYQYTVTINNSGKLSTKKVEVFERASTDIYFIKNATLSKYYDQYLGNVKYTRLPTTLLTDKKIRTQVINILKNINGELTSETKAKQIVKWTRTELNYSSYNNTRKGASGTLSSKLGNCCDQTHLTIAMLRMVGIPSRYRHCPSTDPMRFISANGKISKPYGHVFGTAYLNGKWLEFDPTSSSVLQVKLSSIYSRGGSMRDKINLGF